MRWHMRRTAAAVILIISLFMAVPVIAGQFENATKAYERGDYKTAYRLFKPLAEQGNADAQYNLGIMYDHGQGVPQAYTKAVRWYRKAAEKGLAQAQFNLGWAYGKGQGIAQDYAEAVRWYRKAAEKGLAQAQFNLGIAYLN